MRVAAGASLVVFAMFVAVVATLPAQRAAAPSPSASTDATTRIVGAAQKVLSTLDDTRRAKVQFPFDGEQRTRWSNLPTGIFARDGVRLGDLTPPQRTAVMSLLETAFSASGYRKVTEIMRGDDMLLGGAGRGGPRGGGAARGGRGPAFGSDEYYLAFVGPPSVTTPWILQFGGHHLAINVTIVGSNNVLTPSLPATQPARYVLNGQTIRPLGDENDKGFALINALDAAQQKQAVLNYRVSDLVLGPGADGKVIQPEGIPASALNASQQALLLDVAHEWVGILNDEAAAAKMAEIKANLPRTYFAWSGATKNGGLAYYRIQGPTLVIEYAPQQGDLDHIHTIYRDPTNDYGAKLVRP